jgi:hypothetical protein
MFFFNINVFLSTSEILTKIISEPALFNINNFMAEENLILITNMVENFNTSSLQKVSPIVLALSKEFIYTPPGSIAENLGNG